MLYSKGFADGDFLFISESIANQSRQGVVCSRYLRILVQQKAD
jgi:hypothetical protein